jgi:hypothetical protein
MMKHAHLSAATLSLLTGLGLMPTLLRGDDFMGPYTPPSATPTPEHFEVCYNHTCKEIAQLSLTPNQWQQIRDRFQPPAGSAAQEREQIAAAVARMEVLVGEKIDTSNEKGGNLQGLSSGGNQFDCIDESTNTTTYLTMMEQDGLLRWHKVEERKTRNLFFIGGWPHTTAVISEKESGKRWAVDSWFYDNGVPPAVLPIQQWSNGWKPPGFKG